MILKEQEWGYDSIKNRSIIDQSLLINGSTMGKSQKSPKYLEDLFLNVH